MFKIIQGVIPTAADTRFIVFFKCLTIFSDLRAAAAGFYISTVMVHICTRNASHCGVNSIPHICLSTTPPVHAQDSTATRTPTFLNRYVLSRPKESLEHRGKTIHYVQSSVKAAAVGYTVYGYHSDIQNVQRCMADEISMDPNGFTHNNVYFLITWL